MTASTKTAAALPWAWETIDLLARGGMGEVWLAERAGSSSSDPFQFYELLAAAYAENHRYREAADTERKAIQAMPTVKPGETPTRARQANEARLAEYERAAKSAGQ